MSKLTPTMLEGLRKMEKKGRDRNAVLAEPNENTGRALGKRGLIERIDSIRGWNYYRVTLAGRLALSEQS